MVYTFIDIISKLESYNELKRKALQLEFELEHYKHKITCEDSIDTMTFNSTLGERIQTGQISDKTANIALSYVEKTSFMNIRDKNELVDDLEQVRLEIDRIEYYISILDEKYSNVLLAIYIENLTFYQTCEKLKISLTSAQRIRKKGVERLVEMYNRLISN